MRIGVDLGGTKIEGVALADDGTELARRRLPTPVGDYPATVAAIARMVAELEGEAGARGSVGVGIPGALSPRTGLVKNANSVCLIGRALDLDLERALERPVRLANDANCFALSEALDGAGRGAVSLFGAILGTGVGGGVAIEGRIHAGANAIAGEWGHNPLPWPDTGELPGPPCYCGKRGCIESFLSGPGLTRDHADHGGEVIEPPLISARAAAGDERARAAMARYERRLAKALASIINVLDPEVIVLGGGLSRLERLYTAVPALWGAYAFSDGVATRLEPPRHGDAGGARGAAWLWPLREAIP